MRVDYAPFAVDQTVDFRRIPRRKQPIAAIFVGNEVAQVIAQHREVSAIAYDYLWVEIFAARNTDASVEISEMLLNSFPTIQEFVRAGVEICHILAVGLQE